MANPPTEKIVTPDRLDKTKKWALMKFRELLRGARVTNEMKRFLSGELPTYRFQVEIALTPDTEKFIDNPKNSERLSKETLL